jgi:hypothetical protein
VQEKMTMYRQSGMVLVLVAAVAVGLAACSGSSSPHVASLGTSTSLGTGGAGNAATNGEGNGSSPTTISSRNPTALLDAWATCMRSHGDPDQVDPVVDADGVIQITLGDSSGIRGPNGEATSCATYLTAAQTALRGGKPVPTPNTFQHASSLCTNETGVSSKFSESPPQPGDINVNVGQPKGAPGGNGGSGANSASVAGG